MCFLLLFLYLFLTKYYITEDVIVKEVLEDKIIFESELGKEITLKVTEYSDTGRPLVTVEKSTQYAGQVHLTKKLNTVGSPQLI